MKKKHIWVCSAIFLLITMGCAMPLKMEDPPTPDLSHLKPLPYTAGLYIPQDLKSYEHKVATSPLDAVVYPLGEQTARIFSNCTAKIFNKVVPVTSLTPTEQVDVIIQPAIVKFDAVIPVPAYNPYTATMVYQADVLRPNGQKVFSQRATGDAQSSKGLMSGFSARGICAKVAQDAMVDAAQQIMEAIADSEEMAHIR